MFARVNFSDSFKFPYILDTEEYRQKLQRGLYRFGSGVGRGIDWNVAAHVQVRRDLSRNHRTFVPLGCVPRLDVSSPSNFWICPMTNCRSISRNVDTEQRFVVTRERESGKLRQRPCSREMVKSAERTTNYATNRFAQERVGRFRFLVKDLFYRENEKFVSISRCEFPAKE